MKTLYAVLATMMMWSGMLAAEEANQTQTTGEQYFQQVKKEWDSVRKRHGIIHLPGGKASLNVPESFYYIDSDAAKMVLVKIWGNPPEGADTLGMLFPEGLTPFDDASWAVTIEYEEDGHISDEDADSIDYDAMLSDMKESVAEESKQRVQNGYDAIELIGWASKPYYDKKTHKLYWAKEIKFGDQQTNTLNYNIRILGREGVLLLNFIAGIDQLPTINNKINDVLQIANFDDGSRYADYRPGIDKLAAYGIGTLIAGKVAAKLGILATVLLFAKKLWIIIMLALGGIFKRFFGKKTDPQEADVEETPADDTSENDNHSDETDK